MKAEKVIVSEKDNLAKAYVDLGGHGFDITTPKVTQIIDFVVSEFNSALSQHVQSELSKNDTMYAFLYCCDTYESSYATVSVHRTRKGAEMAMEFHRNEAKKKHDEIYNRLDDIYTHPFGESEDWQISEIKIFE